MLVDGALGLYVERGGKTVLNFLDADDEDAIARGGRARSPRPCGRPADGCAIERIDGEFSVGAPLGDALIAAGFAATPQGLRLRG